MSNPDLIDEVTELVLEACEKDRPEGGLDPDDVLFGPESPLELDSLDALQLAMALQRRYGLRLADNKQTRKIFVSVRTLADYIEANAQPVA